MVQLQLMICLHSLVFVACVRRHDGVQESRERAASESSAGKPAMSAVSMATGRLYMVRVVGPMFSFYSVNPSTEFLDVFEDYKRLPSDQDPPATIVHKCSFTFPADPNDSAAKPITTNIFSFLLAEHRQLIISMLDWIRIQITA